MNLLQQALARFDTLNQADPVQDDGEPRAYVYGQRMSAILAEFCPGASPALQLAVRAQHLMRWQIARSDFPEGRQGYLAWRKACAKHHAALAERELAALGAEPALGERVATLIRKERFKTDAEAQTLEDVACLVFLRYEADAFLAKTDAEKIPAIVQKTWVKMSDAGHAAALRLLPELPERVQSAVRAALGG